MRFRFYLKQKQSTQRMTQNGTAFAISQMHASILQDLVLNKFVFISGSSGLNG